MTFTIAHVTDCHLGATWGRNPAETLAAVIDAISVTLPEPPDALLVTGDIAHNALEAEYEEARTLLARLRVPIFALPGNHDSRVHLRRYFSIPGTSGTHLSYAVELGPVRLVALDTQSPGEDGGRIDTERQRWLDVTLGEDSSTPTLLAMHHPPVATGVRAMDACGIRTDDRRAFVGIVARHPQVRLIVAGHVHGVVLAAVNRTPVIAVPSTTVPFALDFDAPRVRPLDERPGFALHRLVDNEIVSHVVQLSPVESAGS